MNLFAVDEDPVVAARCLIDRHVVKMATETAQILCTAARVYLGQEAPYKPTHAKHPCVLWVKERRANWAWAVEHGVALCDEFERRYGKAHGSRWIIEEWAADKRHGPKPSRRPRQPFAQVMPEKYRGPDPVAAYRRYYVAEKASFASWRAPAVPPAWWFPNAFDARVAQVVCSIPLGQTLSYAQVALRAGKPGGARRVARALRHSRGLPWWRVIRSDGIAAPEVADEQLRRLAREGVKAEGRRVLLRRR